MSWRRWIVLGGILGAGCRHAQAPGAEEGPPQDRTKAGFPTVQALAALAARPAPIEAPGQDRGLEVERWALTGPFPQGWQEAHPSEGPLPAALAAILQKRQAPAGLSASMHCAAREVGLFYLRHERYPTTLLRQFIGARCRAADAGYAIQTLRWRDKGKTSDADLLQEAQGQLAKMVESLPAQEQDYGVWFGTEGQQAIAVLVGGQAKVLITESQIQDRLLELKGRTLTPLDSLQGAITLGRSSYGTCEVDFRAPDFSMSCPLGPEDDSAWLEISGQAPGRWVANTLTSWVLPLSTPSPEYVGLSGTSTVATKDPRQLRQSLALEIDRARREHHLPPLRYDEPQSTALGQVTPHYFAAQVGALPIEAVDMVAMGAQAGWKVQGQVRQGSFVSSASMGGGLPYLVGAMLARPNGRAVVLDPEAQRLALGVYLEDQGFSGAIIATYRLIEPAAEPQLKAQTWAIFNKGRAAFSQAPAEALEDVAPELMTELAASPQGSAERTLNALLAQAAARYVGQRVRGWYLEVQDPSELTFPQELLRAPGLRCLFMLTHYQPAHEPWARYVLFVVVPEWVQAALDPAAPGPS